MVSAATSSSTTVPWPASSRRPRFWIGRSAPFERFRTVHALTIPGAGSRNRSAATALPDEGRDSATTRREGLCQLQFRHAKAPPKQYAGAFDVIDQVGGSRGNGDEDGECRVQLRGRCCGARVYPRVRCAGVLRGLRAFAAFAAERETVFGPATSSPPGASNLPGKYVWRTSTAAPDRRTYARSR